MAHITSHTFDSHYSHQSSIWHHCILFTLPHIHIRNRYIREIYILGNSNQEVSTCEFNFLSAPQSTTLEYRTLNTTRTDVWLAFKSIWFRCGAQNVTLSSIKWMIKFFAFQFWWVYADFITNHDFIYFSFFVSVFCLSEFFASINRVDFDFNTMKEKNAFPCISVCSNILAEILQEEIKIT